MRYYFKMNQLGILMKANLGTFASLKKKIYAHSSPNLKILYQR